MALWEVTATLIVELTLASPRWVYTGPYGGRRYNWAQCRFCGRAGQHDCVPAACLLCESVQCNDKDTCRVGLYGWMPGWYRGHGRRITCGYKGCERQPVANAPRVRQVCAEHVTRVKVRCMGGWVPLLECVADRIAHRDSGDGWERFRFVR